jgi:hypothetical protein
VRRFVPFVLFLLFLSCLSGYLMSKPSLIGKVGIDLFYKEYKFLRTWWQGALAVFITLLVLLFLQGLIQRKLSRNSANLIQVVMILLALAGFYFTWYDFKHTTTHRWLKTSFHIGAYLFWLGWIIVSVFYLTASKTRQVKQ